MNTGPIRKNPGHIIDIPSPWNHHLFHKVPSMISSGNTRATGAQSSDPRSESCIAINPLDAKNMIGASKRFIDPEIYQFKIGPIFTFDGGSTWTETELPMQEGWDGMTDPTMVFDDVGYAYLVGEPLTLDRTKLHTGQDVNGLGMYAYRSTDGGRTWEQPVQLTTDTTDDKQWLAADTSPTSPHRGNVYVAWGANYPLKFARSLDHGVTWKGMGNLPPGSTLPGTSYGPDLSVSSDGVLHIFWHLQGSTEIEYARSADGGETFEPTRSIVTGMTSLSSALPKTGGWSHFDGGKFRVLTLATSCAGPNATVTVAWADGREGVSRIYFRRSLDRGNTWEGPEAGEPVLSAAQLPAVAFGSHHCFHPQLETTGSGDIGCAYYRFGPGDQSKLLISTMLVVSRDGGAQFLDELTVTDQPWDPLIAAPWAHGDPNVQFIGEYFGLAAAEDSLALLWTDTRTHEQQLFSDVITTQTWVGPKLPPIPVKIPHLPVHIPSIVDITTIAGQLVTSVRGYLRGGPK